MKIYAPVKDANGVFASVMFVNGVGETDNMALIDWFSNHGYKIGGGNPTQEVEKTVDFYSMTPYELREWAKENGLAGKVRNIKNRDRLLEILTKS